MMNPMKHTSSRDQRLWSEWIESLTKDVECYFGILEGRSFTYFAQWHAFTIPKIDQVVFTCCILRNLIREADGLDIRWEQQAEWDKLNPQTSNFDEG